MYCVVPAPERIGRQRQYTQGPAEQVIRAARLEERAVTAVMLEHEQPNEQRGCRQGERQRCPTIAADAIEEGCHKRQKRDYRVNELKDGTLGVGPGIGRYDLLPRAGVIVH